MTELHKVLAQTPELSGNEYCCFGLATCFIRQEGETTQLKIIEPIPSAALEAIVKGVPTSYELICGLTLNDFLQEQRLTIPQQLDPQAQFCDRFTERSIAAIRTYQARPEAQGIVPLNTTSDRLNYSLERKRILNAASVVKTEDNVKQHQYTHQVL